MSFIPTLKTTLGVAFILTTAGAISVSAQTQAVADNSSTNAPANASRTRQARIHNRLSSLLKAERRTTALKPNDKPAVRRWLT